MFINTGARNLLLQSERQKFLAEEWPKVSATIQRLGLTPQELLQAATTPPPSNPPDVDVKEEPKP
jgi:GntR family transcriptional regulator